MIGNAKQTMDTVRQAINVFITNTIDIPMEKQINVYPSKMLRVDGSLRMRRVCYYFSANKVCMDKCCMKIKSKTVGTLTKFRPGTSISVNVFDIESKTEGLILKMCFKLVHIRLLPVLPIGLWPSLADSYQRKFPKWRLNWTLDTSRRQTECWRESSSLFGPKNLLKWQKLNATIKIEFICLTLSEKWIMSLVTPVSTDDRRLPSGCTMNTILPISEQVRSKIERENRIAWGLRNWLKWSKSHMIKSFLISPISETRKRIQNRISISLNLIRSTN